MKLVKFEMPKIGVYFLYKNDDLVYIGQSINIFNRLYSHVENGKDFDFYSFVKCDTQKEAETFERYLINKYKPILNKRIWSKDIENIDKSIEWHKECLIKLIDKKEFLENEYEV